MPDLPKRTWALTSLADDDACYLEVGVAGGVARYEVSQFVASWACNEIPQAQCMVALGRDARDVNLVAEANRSGFRLQSMQRARVYFRPRGDYNPEGAAWPDAEVVLFDGYFVGASYRKSNGKVGMVFNLVHWLVDLSCSSAVAQNSHPANPAHLTAPAVLEQISRVGGAKPAPGDEALRLTQQPGSLGAYVSGLTGFTTVRDFVISDFWSGIKRVFCGLANVRARAAGPLDSCLAAGGLGSAVRNSRALSALRRMEGPTGSAGDAQDADRVGCDLPYAYGVPLSLDTSGVDLVKDAVAATVTDGMVTAYANTTFWDKLVGEFCPQFGLAVVPLVDTAIVIADTPAYNQDYWKEVTPDEYDTLDQNTLMERPLRVVSVVGNAGSQTGSAGPNPLAKAAETTFQGGCYVAGSVDDDDGVVMFVAAPKWLQVLANAGFDSAAATGLDRNRPVPGAVGPAVPPSDQPVFSGNAVNELYVKYAQTVYISHMLRGRVGAFSGKLRFDIAPGSNIKLRARAERFLDGEDDLAADLYANVSRVTVSINCESGQAGTSFQLSHIRFAQENDSPRTSTDGHPLFGRQIHGFGRNGAPLLPEYDALET